MFLQEIDGRALMLLRSDVIMKYMGLKLGPALKLCHHIERLRQNKRWRSSVLTAFIEPRRFTEEIQDTSPNFLRAPVLGFWAETSATFLTTLMFPVNTESILKLFLVKFVEMQLPVFIHILNTWTLFFIWKTSNQLVILVRSGVSAQIWTLFCLCSISLLWIINLL